MKAKDLRAKLDTVDDDADVVIYDEKSHKWFTIVLALKGYILEEPIDCANPGEHIKTKEVLSLAFNKEELL